MKELIPHWPGRLALLGLILGLSIFIGLYHYRDAPIFVGAGAALMTEDQYTYLAASRGSYSDHQPHSHSTFTLRSSRGTRYVPKPAATSTPTVAPAPPPAPPPAPAPLPPPPAPAIAPTPPPPPVSAQSALAGRFGLSVGATLSWLSDADLNSELDKMNALGVGWVRYDFEWDQIQAAGPTSYNWAATDRVVKAVLAHHLKLLPIIAYSPPWARPSGCGSYMCGPANPADYAAFARVVVARYAPQGIHQWEIWNEPNTSGFWKPAPDPSAYAALLKGAYAAIKGQDPTAIVVSGGLSP